VDTRCEQFGMAYGIPQFGGATANDACCVCGGGSSGPECSPDESFFEVELQTDLTSNENSFVIKKRAEDGSSFKLREKEDPLLFPSATVTYKNCFPSDSCFEFAIKDLFGDGLSNGFYKVNWDGEVIKESLFVSGSEEKTQFGSC